MRSSLSALVHVLALSGALPGCFSTLPVGSGVVVDDPRAVEPFAAVYAQNGLIVDVSIVPDAPLAVTVTGDDNLVGYVETSVSEGTLTVRLPERTTSPNDPERLHVTISTPTLASVGARGAARVSVEGMTGEALTLGADSAAQVTVSGEVARLDVRASAQGSVAARTLTARTVVASGDAGGRIEVCATERVELHLNGGAHALYACSPTEVTEDVQGGASATAE